MIRHDQSRDIVHSMELKSRLRQDSYYRSNSSINKRIMKIHINELRTTEALWTLMRSFCSDSMIKKMRNMRWSSLYTEVRVLHWVEFVNRVEHPTGVHRWMSSRFTGKHMVQTFLHGVARASRDVKVIVWGRCQQQHNGSSPLVVG